MVLDRYVDNLEIFVHSLQNSFNTLVPWVVGMVILQVIPNLFYEYHGIW